MTNDGIIDKLRQFSAEYNIDMFSPDKTMFRLIFSHSFAKAFWGEDKVVAKYSVVYYDMQKLKKIDSEMYISTWQYHLQMMVLEEEPLKYLEKFL